MSDMSINYIENTRHFNNIRNVATLGKTFNLRHDIDLGASETNSWIPFPRFDGVLNGGSHIVKNMIIRVNSNYSGNLGLFESNNGYIQYLTVVGRIIVDGVDGGQIYAGMFAGINYPSGSIEYCYSNLESESENPYVKTKTSLDGRYEHENYEIICYRVFSDVGGYVGRNQGFIGYGDNNSDLFSSGNVAGVAGTTDGGKITYCNSNQNRSINYLWQKQNRCAAGITGYLENGEVCNCVNLSNIACINESLGDDTDICPEMAQIIGGRIAGVYNENFCNGSVDKGKLHEFKYGGFLGIGQKSHDQAKFVSNGQMGRSKR